MDSGCIDRALGNFAVGKGSVYLVFLLGLISGLVGAWFTPLWMGKYSAGWSYVTIYFGISLALMSLTVDEVFWKKLLWTPYALVALITVLRLVFTG
ncbi:hypothetical protein KKI23_00985 [Patescibacteria group bacterium]|nr:hypothetical protein [Patescibacteria group bacterium]